MDTFIIELANDRRSHKVEAARWECTEDYYLTSFDDENNEIATWEPTEWYRLVEQTDAGKSVDKHRNPNVANPKYS